MAKSMLEMHPEEFAQRDNAWQRLTKKGFLRKPSLEDVKVILKAEASIFEVSNNNRRDSQLDSFIALDTPDKRLAAQTWFQNFQNVCRIAYQNAEKVEHLHKPDVKHQEKLLASIEACKVAIKILDNN